jgi:hypothetical protein
MLRQKIAVSLAMTACASLIPTKANAASLTLEPSGNLLRNPGDSIEFVLAFNPNSFTSPSGNEVELRGYTLTYDDTELSLVRLVDPIDTPTRFSTTTTLARYIFRVLPGVRIDREGDVFPTRGDVFATANYREEPRFINFPKELQIGGPVYDVQPVPEPLTILSAATALGYGVILKRKSSKKTVS